MDWKRLSTTGDVTLDGDAENLDDSNVATGCCGELFWCCDVYGEFVLSLW